MICESALHGRAVSVGFQDMYAPQVLQIKKALDDGSLDACEKSASQQAGREITPTTRATAGRGRRPARAGRFLTLHCAMHLPTSSISPCTSPERNPARWRGYHQSRVAFPLLSHRDIRHSARLVQYPEGIEIGCILTHAATERLEPRIEITCDHGTLQWCQEDQARIVDLRGETILEWQLDPRRTNRRRMLAQVIRDTRDGRAPACSAAMALHHVEAFRLAARELPIEDGPTALQLANPEQASRWSGTPGSSTACWTPSLPSAVKASGSAGLAPRPHIP